MQKKIELSVQELEERAKAIRLATLEMIYRAGSGHPGPSLSTVDILTVLYFSVMKIQANNPSWPDRDRFILSKGHAAPALYATLAEAGFFPKEFLNTFRQVGLSLQGHPDMKSTPGVDMTSGALGNGVAIGAGMALAARLTKRTYRTYVLLGDGECQEGEVWEAAMAAPTKKLGNLTAIIDRNGFNQTGCTENSSSLEPLPDRWKAFGWRVLEIDGHSIKSLLEAFCWAAESEEQPSLIIAKTIKGKGISFMEGKPEWHAKSLSSNEMAQARIELKN